MKEFLINNWIWFVLGLIVIVLVCGIVILMKQENKAKAKKKVQTTVKNENVNDTHKTNTETMVKKQDKITTENTSKTDTLSAEQKNEKVKTKATAKKTNTKENKAKKVTKGNDDTALAENIESAVKRTITKYSVSYDKDNKDWVVKKTGSKKASKRCKAKSEALEIATRLSGNQDLSLSIRKKNGKFQKAINAERELNKLLSTKK